MSNDETFGMFKILPLTPILSPVITSERIEQKALLELVKILHRLRLLHGIPHGEHINVFYGIKGDSETGVLKAIFEGGQREVKEAFGFVCLPEPQRESIMDLVCSHEEESFLGNPEFKFTLILSRLTKFVADEYEILRFWEEIRAFEMCLEMSKGKKPFSFYDGPPFATGLPHYGHILAGTIKDVVTRYAHMTGHYVERRFGWDCHGLPVEYEIDKKLGIKSREDVLAMGIDKYNQECRSIVMRYSGEWEVVVKRVGRWIDFRNDYKTLNPTFMETVWWVFKQLFDKNQVYRGYRVRV